MGHLIGFEAVDQLVDQLRALSPELKGPRVTTEPSELELPGILVEVRGVRFDTLDGFRIETRLLLVAPDNGTRRAMTTLSQLYNHLAPVLEPDGDLVARTVQLPENATPLPALEVPLDIPALVTPTP